MAQKLTEMDYFQQGAEAYRQGKPEGANPYAWNPHENQHLRAHADWWLQGWESERRAATGVG